MKSPHSFIRALAVVVPVTVVLGAMAGPASAAKPTSTATPTITTATKSPTSSTSATFSFKSSTRGATYTCGLDTTTLTACTSPQTFSGLHDGTHIFRVRAKAPGRSASAVASFTWKVDTQPPPAPTVTVPASPSNVASPQITLVDTESGVGFRCSLDSAVFSTCSSPYSPGSLADGLHTVVVEAVDAAGNASAPTSKSWVIDTVPPPAPQITLGPANPSKDGSYSFLFVDAEGDATFSCSVDGGAFAACSSPATGTVSPSGNHTFVVRAADPAGNTAASSTFGWKVDPSVNPPTITLGAQGTPAPITSSTSATFTFTGSPATCSLDGASAAACTSPVSYTGLGEGQHTFAVTTGSGPTASTVRYVWTIDKTPPPAPVITGPGGPTASTSATFGVSDSENGVTLTCRVDGGAAAACPGQLVLTGLTQGSHTLVATATDAAGNATSASRSWTVDTVGPKATIAINAAIVGSSKVTFNEDVRGVSASSVFLRVSGTTRTAATALGCRDAANVVVSCTAGPVRTAFVSPTAALIPGEHYTLSATSGIVDLAGNALTAASAAYRAATVQQENSQRAVYGWRPVANAAAYGSNYHVEHLAATTAAIGFTGTSVTWYTLTGPRQGIAKVYVDGVLKATVNNYAPANHWRVARTVSGLSVGSHVLKIYVTGTRSRASSGTEIIVDALNAGTLVGNPRWLFGWRHVGTRAASGGGFSMADLPGAATSFTFHGTGIAWYTAVSRTQGIARVYVDGVLKATVDNYSATTGFGARRFFGGLSNANHVVRVMVTGTHRAGAAGTQVIIDRWVVS